MIRMLHKMGIRSHHAYMAGTASIGLAFASWLMSNTAEHAGMDRADRWGIFIGEWAPTFYALGVALRLEEMQMEPEEMREMETGRTESEVFDRTSSGMTQRSHTGV
ncbi:hypothetical protein ACWGH8_06575 [Nonomuraea muscovyensis]|uniref:Uncharacterized protein n=1 Tax=Nonomuraea muscovyensis TaxID=1124761 RepID=A0A7X0C9Y8_9ACTN|nr:hypothetical protein [Nonomuraea muscovyensis]MBB6349424.1 hypothetical protein [Nonomuraea muscovyensis]MDF2705741.1 hypothetical protein [Nonomuraea muscovyensis]